ncbi:hypothetical protein LOTGIDRAFT_163283 [Lottia gigantea]|uniref:COMM domain-containing protein n=1 Tax=Lottia gigantea TaxID=225164 RepID=V4BRN3_LOTGI|nr:hypothetical protein LOTGIDRAFT_163283 [Lottia gigantea]ESO91559.1 hypothetical protein LOTGIDRAFT_163283 [Lottia gigantea]
MQCDFSDLNVLLKASAKEDVIRICEEAFLYRNQTKLPDNIINTTIGKLDIDKSASLQLYKSLGSLLKQSVFLGSADPQDLVKLYPGDFQKNLRDLLIRITIDHMTNWKSIANSSQVSLPNLVDFDWRVDVKTASDSIARMSVPTCILNMQVQESRSKSDSMSDINGIQVQESRSKSDSMSDINGIQVELSKETLETMLDGLSKIRDQLNSVAQR